MSAAQGALDELRDQHHAQKLPTSTEMNSAEKGTAWHGALASGGSWTLTKNGPDSFTSHTS